MSKSIEIALHELFAFIEDSLIAKEHKMLIFLGIEVGFNNINPNATIA